MKKTLVLSCALALASLSTAAMAADGHAFVRAEVGNADSDFQINGAKGSDDDTSYSVRGGYWFNANFALEGFYSNLYDQSENGSSLKLSAIGVGAVIKKHVTSNETGFFVGARAGMARLKGEAGLAGVGSGSDFTNESYIGAGVGYDFNESFGVTLNYDVHQRADFSGISVNTDNVTLGGEYRF
ncbi:outer membrane beta-barrel protein [Lysobacter tyrosinilyticus]